MALIEMLREEFGEVGSLIRRFRHSPSTSTLGANFRNYGPALGAYDFDAFIDMAEEFYEEGIHSDDPSYTVIRMNGDRVAIDKNGEKRGIYTRKGKPVAFFKPDFRASGYTSKEEEISAFRGDVKFVLPAEAGARASASA